MGNPGIGRPHFHFCLRYARLWRSMILHPKTPNSTFSVCFTNQRSNFAIAHLVSESISSSCWAIFDFVIDGPRPHFRVFSDGVADVAPPNFDPILPKNSDVGRIAIGLTKSNFTGPVLDNSDPIFPKVCQRGSRLRPSIVEFRRLRPTSKPFQGGYA